MNNFYYLFILIPGILGMIFTIIVKYSNSQIDRKYNELTSGNISRISTRLVTLMLIFVAQLF